MRLCTSCRRFTSGDPVFCGNCGRTYHVRLCPRLHVNPRTAQVCTQCGSRELTQPQPPVGASTAILLRLITILPGVVLLGLTALVGTGFLQALLTNQQVQGDLMVLLLLVGMAWVLYTQLPTGMRQVARWGWRAVKRVSRRS